MIASAVAQIVPLAQKIRTPVKIVEALLRGISRESVPLVWSLVNIHIGI